MWLWQPKSRHKSYVCARITYSVCAAHLLLFVVIFLLDANKRRSLQVTTRTAYADAAIVVLPFCKYVAPATQAEQLPVPQKPPKAAPQTTIQQTKKAVPKKKTSPATKAPAQKPKQAPSPKPAPKKVVQQQKMPSVVPKKQPPTAVKKDASTQKEPTQSAPATAPVYVGREQMQEIALQETLVQEVQRCWAPPVGLSKALETIVVVNIGPDGAIEQVTTQKASGVLAYDMSARSACYAMHFSKPFHNKEITITFKQ